MNQRKFLLLKNSVETFIASMPLTMQAGQLKELDDLLGLILNYIDHNNEALFLALYLKAVRDHYEPQSNSYGHIYLQKYEIPQIELFDILLNKFPFVLSGHALVNNKIKELLSSAEYALLIDVGTGRGIQMSRLLESLTENSNLKELTIIGIEPFEDAIKYAAELIEKTGADLPFKVKFVPLHSLVEKLDKTTLIKTFPKTSQKPIVNAAFVIHHLRTEEERNTFFSLMHDISADAILLTEPHSDHMEPAWKKRATNAYKHYGALYALIDKLDIGTKEKNGLKMFFGREIDDVVGNPEHQRYERHEPTEKWLSYLKNNHFKSQKPAKEITTSLIAAPVNCSYDNAGCWRMGYNGVDILSAIYAVPSKD